MPGLNGAAPNHNYVWDGTKWVKMTQPGGGGGGGGTSSNFGAAFPASGTAAGFIDSSGNMAGANLDSSGNLKVNVVVGGGSSSVSVADGADVAQGATTDAAVLDANGTVNAHVRGVAKVVADVWDSVNHWFKVSIQNTSLAVTQSGSWVLSAGSAIIGKVSIDQTTPGTTNAVAVTNLPTTVDVNSGVKSNSTIRVVLATDQPQLTNKLLVTPDSVALPANQSVDVSRLAGTATDTNSGAKSAGTLRVVLATDQPQLTNKLLVTPDSVALPANQSVDLSRVAGTATDTNSGNKSAGTLRVTLATDQVQLTNPLLVAPIAGQSGVQGASGVVTALTQRVVLATDVALPAGTNAIGKLAANDGVDVGDVTINNAAGASAVNVQDGGNSLTVDNAGTFAVQDSEKVADNAAFTDSTTKVQPAGYVYDDIDNILPLTENDAAAARVDLKRAQVSTIEDAYQRGQGFRTRVLNDGALQTTMPLERRILEDIFLQLQTLVTVWAPGYNPANLPKLPIQDNQGRQLGAFYSREQTKTALVTLNASTSETTLIVADPSYFIDIIAVVAVNTSASTNTRLDFRDATGGSVVFPLMSIGGSAPVGFSLSGVPIPQTMKNNNWTVQCATSTADVRVFALYALASR